MGSITVKLMVEGGKANAGPPLGPALAVHKINIPNVVAKINEATKEFSGISVPVEVIVNTDTKQFEVKVGSPPTSQLIKKELKLETLAKAAWKEPAVGNLTIHAAVKIAKAKLPVLGTSDLKKATKEIVATCLSLGVTVEGKNPKEIIKEIAEGKWDHQIK
jgi:large subunit ribosomal protein L11